MSETSSPDAGVPSKPEQSRAPWGHTAAGSLRLFVAVAAPPSVSEIIREVLPAYDGKSRRRKFTGRDLASRVKDSLHITLAFLGDVPEERLLLVQDALEAAKGPPSFKLGLAPLGCFRRGTSYVLWAGLEPSDHLTGLKSRVDMALAGVLPPRPDAGRPFAPHMTLARLNPMSLTQPRPPKHPEKLVPKGYFLVQEFGLYRSDFFTGGNRHTLLRSYPLKFLWA
jgi:2'-5' RNA ligase